jgi:hypothetical protein
LYPFAAAHERREARAAGPRRVEETDRDEGRARGARRRERAAAAVVVVDADEDEATAATTGEALATGPAERTTLEWASAAMIQREEEKNEAEKGRKKRQKR